MEHQNRIRTFLGQVNRADGASTASYELLHSDLPPLQNPWFTPQPSQMETSLANMDDFGVGLPPLAGK
jgi:hypothetical protein